MGKILIVDDSKLVRRVASTATKEAGHEPVLAENGKEGLEILESGEKIDLVFSDVNMPVMDGFEMIENIRKNPSLKFLPVVMLTTETNSLLKAKGKNCGVKSWMLKPFNKEKFFTAIKKLLG